MHYVLYIVRHQTPAYPAVLRTLIRKDPAERKLNLNFDEIVTVISALRLEADNLSYDNSTRCYYILLMPLFFLCGLVVGSIGPVHCKPRLPVVRESRGQGGQLPPPSRKKC